MMDEDDNMSDSDFGEDEDPDKIEVPGLYYRGRKIESYY